MRRPIVSLLDPIVRRRIDGVAARLVEEYAGVFSRETVEQVVADSLDRLGPVSVMAHLPVLTERFARQRLRAVAHIEGLVAKPRPAVLFICVQNAARSQMAAALARHISEGRIDVMSAGSDPVSAINASVVDALDELGLETALEFPKPLTDEVVRAADVVVTMGCGDACPIFPGPRYLDWDVADPADQDLEAVRAIRQDIANHILDLLKELL